MRIELDGKSGHMPVMQEREKSRGGSGGSRVFWTTVQQKHAKEEKNETGSRGLTEQHFL